jgi:hypothetical protein
VEKLKLAGLVTLSLFLSINTIKAETIKAGISHTNYALDSIHLDETEPDYNIEYSLATHIDSTNPFHRASNKKKHKSKIAFIKPKLKQKYGPITVKVRVNPLNRRRNQASINLDLVETYDIVTHKKKFECDRIKLTDVKNYFSKDNFNSMIAAVKEEISPVQ